MPEIVILPAMFLAIVAIIKIVTDNRIKTRLIQEGLVDEKVKFLYQSGSERPGISNVKWGLVLVGIGLAAMIGFWFPEAVSEEGVIGLMFIFAGLGFLIYYFVASRGTDSRKDNTAN